MKRLWVLVFVLWLSLGGARAETSLYVFSADDPPLALTQTAYQVLEGETDVVLTFAGDCTLGGEPPLGRSRFDRTVARNGLSYPFQNLQTLFATDDLTVINLEGVLSTSTSGRVEKAFNFIGDPSYTGILTEGYVECVNLANNHARDFGQQGYDSTVSALDAAGVGYYDEDTLCVVEKDGVRIGLTATQFHLSDEKQEKLAQQVALLRSLGCSAILHTMHAGQEYAQKQGAQQERIAQAAAELGVSLVVGHHPHVVEGVDVLGSMPVVYSLGNLSFGGNNRPRDYDALLLRATLHFDTGSLTALDWSLYPVRISGARAENDFQPYLLTGEDAARVMEKVQNASTITLAPFTEGEGAVQETILIP